MSLEPPPAAIYDQSRESHSGNGSIGPVIGVLAVIFVLGVIAGIVGRLCTGRRIFGYGQFDFEAWIERKCASCIDGRIDAPPSAANGSGGAAVAAPEVAKNRNAAEMTEL